MRWLILKSTVNYWEKLHAFLLSADFFSTFHLLKKRYFKIMIRVSNGLDPDQARHFVGPDLGLNCLQQISADDTSKL